MASHVSESILDGKSSRRTRSEKTSAPPPGSASRPASRKAAKQSLQESEDRFDIWSISTAVKALTRISGPTVFIALRRSEIIGEIRFRVDGSYQVYFPESRNPRPVYLSSDIFGLEQVTFR